MASKNPAGVAGTVKSEGGFVYRLLRYVIDMKL
jgi:hypothetical protein